MIRLYIRAAWMCAALLPMAVWGQNDALLRAVRANDTLAARKALLKKASPNYRLIGPNDKTPLLVLALQQPDLGMAQWLLAAGANPEAPRAELAQVLPPKPGQAQPDTLWNEYTPLHAAIETRNEAAVKLLLARGVKLDRIATGPNLAATPLHVCVRMGLADVAKLFVAKGANLEAQDHAGLSPLVYAVRFRQYEMMRLLLLAEAATNGTCAQNNVPLAHAAEIGDLQAAKILLALPDVNPLRPCKTPQGLDAETPLHIAARKGHADIAMAILNKCLNEGLEIDMRCNGLTALDYADLYAHADLKAAMAAKGVQSGFAMAEGPEGLYFAIQMGHAQQVQSLVATQFAPNIPLRHGAGTVLPADLAAECLARAKADKGNLLRKVPDYEQVLQALRP